MTKPISEQERREINEALARAMGYHTRISVTCWDDESDCWEDAPDFTRDASASRELVLWLAKQDEFTQSLFLTRLAKSVVSDWDGQRRTWERQWARIVMAILIADPLTIARAAREAIGEQGK